MSGVPIVKPGSRPILYVAYPLLPVSELSSGGAEQVLVNLERELAHKGWSTTVAACEGSQAWGGVFATGAACAGALDTAQAHEQGHARKILELISIREAIGRNFELIHDHSGSFFEHAPECAAPVLATLHLPRSFYRQDVFAKAPENLFFNCVSASQAADFADVPRMLGPVANGIALERFKLETRKQNYLLWLGRICQEKGTHIALDVAEKAGMPIVIAGKVYPLAYHQQYFEREIIPRLERMGAQARFVESPSFADKVSLLRGARTVLIPSLAEETSSLVAMEAAACGTPVIAFRRGALGEVVSQDETGLLVNDMGQMVQAVARVGRIKPRTCHDYAQQNFSARRMASEYTQLYETVLSGKVQFQAA